MTPNNWKDMAELIGIAAIVGSLIFVGLQMRQDREVAISQINQSTLDATVEIDAAIAEHAAVWEKAGNGEDLTTAEEIILGRLVNMWRLRAFFEQMSLDRIDAGESNGSVVRFAIVLYENPGARKLFTDRVKQDEVYFDLIDGSGQMLDFYNEVLSYLDKLESMNR